MSAPRSAASLVPTPRTPRRTLRFYAGVPRALARQLLATVNQGWTPEAWRAEQKRINAAAARRTETAHSEA